MAKFYLDNNDVNQRISNKNTSVYGANATESVIIDSGVTGTIVDQNVESATFATGSTSDYKYSQSGNKLKVYAADGTTLVADVALNSAGTPLTFSNGTVTAAYSTTGVINLGGKAVTSTATVIDTAATVDATKTSGGTGGTTSTVTGSTFTLTTGVDQGAAFTGTSYDDKFIAGDTTATTWTVGDALDGGAGTDNLFVIKAAAITVPTAATVTNIENISATSGADITLNTTTGFTGLTSLTTNGVGAATITTAASTAVSVTTATLGTAAVAINGGSTVTTSVTGQTTGTIAVGANVAATGAVTVSTAGVYADGANNTTGAITVTGGTTVTVTTATGITAAQQAVDNTDGAAHTLTQSGVTVTGNSTTTAATVTQAAAVVEVDDVTIGRTGVKNGAIAINDANRASASLAGTITTATLNNYGDSTIDSGALTTVNISGTGGTLGITTGALTTPAVRTLALNVNGLSYKNAGTNNAITVDTDITTLNIDSSTASSTVNNITANSATTVNVSGSALLTLTNNTFPAATTINVTNTAGAVFGTTAIGAAVQFTGGAGADTIILSNLFTKVNNMGAGNDTVTYAGLAGTGGSVVAGDGTDTIIMATASADAVDASSVFNTTFTGFETLQISDAHTTSIDLDGINAASKVVFVLGSNAGIISNLISGGTVQTKATNAGTTAINIKSSLASTTDVLNYGLSATTIITGGTVTVPNVETINISAPDASTSGSAAVTHTLTLTASAATSIVVTGNNGLNLTATGSTLVTNFDASGVVGNSTVASTYVAATTDSAANLAVTYVSVNATANAAVVIKGGAGNDVLTGSAAALNIDTITGGEGADSITGGTGNDLIILTETTPAADTVALIASATNGVDVIRGFSAGTSGLDIVNLIDTETTVGTAANATAVFAATTTAALTTGASAFVLTGIATTTTLSDVVEINTSLSSFGNLGLSGATSGTELLKALSSTDSASTGITLDTASDDFYLIAYQNSNAYLYKVTDTGDTNATASEIALVGVFEGVAAGAFASGDFIA
jgi:S-layer protein